MRKRPYSPGVTCATPFRVLNARFARAPCGYRNMKGYKIWIFLIVLAACSGTSFARLGGSPQSVGQRYGAPLSADSVGVFTRMVYQKDAFEITVFYQNGVSILETFARRGLDQPTARQVVALIAAQPILRPIQCDEDKLRKDTGITGKDEVFWTWTAATLPMNAAYNPVECTVAFFSKPADYASVHQALADAPL
jgi:hypothetical protein